MVIVRSKQPGFTIVELLIVIVVIGILAAITVVAYNGITTRAQDAATSANTKGLSEQLETYGIQNNNSFPGYSYFTTLNDPSFGSVLYAYQDLTSDFSSGLDRGVAGSSFQNQYGINLSGRAVYVSITLPTGGSHQYYLASFALGVFSSRDAIPAANRITRLTDNVVPNVSGWYLLNSSTMKVVNGVIVCNNGGSVSASYPTGATWASQNSPGSPKIRVPLLVNNKISLGSTSLQIATAYVGCSGGGSGTLYELVFNDSGMTAAYGYPAVFPTEGSTVPTSL